MNKKIEYGSNARDILKSGVDGVANAVKVTLGARGRNVLLDRGFPHFTKDGVTVSKEIEFADPMKNIGATVIKNAAQKTCDDAGDATTTTCVLAQCIVDAGMNSLKNGANPMEIKKGIDKAVKVVVDFIKKNSTPVTMDNIKDIATVSANNDPEIGQLIADAFKIVTPQGVINVETSRSFETKLEIVNGMRFNKGYYSPYFINTPNNECILKNPYILVSDKKIDSINALSPIIEKIMNENNTTGKNRPLLIICDEMEVEPLSALVINAQKGQFKSCIVQTPGFGDTRKDWSEDVCCITGAKFISDNKADMLINIEIEDLGQAESITINRYTTTIVGGRGDELEIKERANNLQRILKETKEDFKRKQLEERISKLIGGIAILKIGGNSEEEIKEKADRIDDAKCAAKAAFEEGFVPGGGIIFMRAVNELGELYDGFEGSPTELLGISIIESAIQAPFMTILSNAGIEMDKDDVMWEKAVTSTGGYGYNVLSEKFEDLYESGIIDPAKVLRVALENAASVSSLLLTTECAVTHEK